MTKEKMVSLTKYLNDLKNRLTAPTPEKQKNNPVTYKQFLEREITIVTKKLDAAKV